MRAMILAAGKGTRVRPITERMPKPMIPLFGRPILEYLIGVLKSAGVDAIMSNLFHLGQKIEAYFGDGHRFGVDMLYSYENELLGSGGGLKRVESFFQEGTFLVLCGDALIDLDLKAALDFHKQKASIATLILKHTDTPESYGIVETNADGKIVSFQEKPKAEEARTDLANTGIYILEPEVLKLIPERTRWDLGGDLFPLLVEKDAPFFGFAADFSWLDLGTVKDYHQAHMSCLQGSVAGVKPTGNEIAPGIFTGTHCKIAESAILQGPIAMGHGVTIKAGAKLTGPVYLGPGCVVEEKAEVQESIVLPYSRLGADAVIRKAIVDRDCLIDVRSGGHVIVDEEDGKILGDSRRPAKGGFSIKELLWQIENTTSA